MPTWLSAKLRNGQERHALSWRLALIAAAVVFAWLSSFIHFSWNQDASAYLANVEKYVWYGEMTQNEAKSYWYRYFVFPIFSMVRDAEATLIAIKAVIAGVLFYSLRNFARSFKDVAVLGFFIFFTPLLSENLTEYLRQGTAIATILLGFSFRSRLFRWALTGVGLFQHAAVAVIIVAEFCGSRGANFFLKRQPPGSIWAINPLLIGTVSIAAVTAGLFAGPFLKVLPFVGLVDFLGGQRGNVLAAIYLGAYMFYLGIFASYFRSAPHLTAFVGIGIVAIFYSLIIDFGRVLALVVPLHLRAGAALPVRGVREGDLVVMFILCVIILFA
jgi:hypothetical protein